MRKIRKAAKHVACGLSLFILASCWSSHEVETLSVYVGVSMDKNRESVQEKQFREKGGASSKRNLITATYQLVAAETGSKTEKSQAKGYKNVSETGDSPFEMIREYSLRTDRPVIGHHLKVIIISEALAGTNRIDELLDFFMRDNDIRSSCLVFISKGWAVDALESKKPGEIPAFRLFGMVDNRYRTNKILPPMPLSKLLGTMQSEKSFLLQNVLSSSGEVKFSGAAVISGKTKKWIGFLEEQDLEGLSWLTGEGKGGVVKAFDPDTGQMITYEVKSTKGKIKALVHEEDISFQVEVKTEGRIIEDWVPGSKPDRNEFLKKMEGLIQEEIRLSVNRTLKKIQKDLRVDVAGFGTKLKIQQPRVWEAVKSDWDERFSGISVDYEVKVLVEEYGSLGGTIKEPAG